MDERVLQAILRFTLDQQGIDKVKSGGKAIQKELEKVQQQANRTREQMARISDLGLKMGAAGAMMTTPLLLSMRTYLQNADKTERYAQRWNAASKEIEQSQARVGRVVASQVVPYMEIAARLSEKMAAAAEKHPGAIGTVLGVGAGLVGSGSLVTMLSQGVRMVADVKFLSAAALMNTAADKMVGAAAGMNTASKSIAGFLTGGSIAASGAIGAGAAVAAGAEGYAGRKLGVPDTVMTILTAGILNKPTLDWIEKLVDSVTNLGKEADNAAPSLTQIIKSFNELSSEDQTSAIGMLGRYQEQESEYARKYAEQRKQTEQEIEQQRGDIVKQGLDKIVEIEQRGADERNQLIANLADQQAQELSNLLTRQAQELSNLANRQALEARDFAQSEARAEESYFAERLQLLKNSAIEAIRAEEDHQRQMRQMRLEHEDRLDELVASRDALGMVRETRQYNREFAQAEEEHSVAMSRMQADNADRLSEMASQFAQEKAQRLAAFEQRLADEKAELTRQQEQQKQALSQQQEQQKIALEKRLAEMQTAERQEIDALKRKNAEELRLFDDQSRRRLADLKQAYDQERQARAQALRTQMNDLLGIQKQGYDQLKQATNDFVNSLIADASRLSSAAAAGDGVAGAGHWSGGYAYWPGETKEEWVMNNATMHQAERMMGAPLSQQNVLAAMRGIGGISIGTITLPGTNMNESQLTRFMQDKFPGLLANALERARGNVPI